MRRVVYSKNALQNLQRLIEQGVERFGETVARAKGRTLMTFVETRLASQPRLGQRVRELKLYKYEVRVAPLVVLYEFDDDELRVHDVVHARTDIPNTDLSEIAW